MKFADELTDKKSLEVVALLRYQTDCWLFSNMAIHRATSTIDRSTIFQIYILSILVGTYNSLVL